jgi:Trk K+ transport system NAD-binding subunit
VVAPLFQERLYVYYTGNKNYSFRDLDSLMEAGKNRFGFTSLKGGSYDMFKEIVRYLNINRHLMLDVQANYDTLINRLERNELDFIVTFSLPLRKTDSLKNIRFLYLNGNDVKLIQNRLRDIFPVRIGKDKYMLGGWTFLVAPTQFIKKIDNPDLVKVLRHPPDSLKNIPYASLISQSIKQFADNKNKESLQLRNLRLYNGLQRQIGFKNVQWRVYIYLGLFVLALLFVHYYYTGKWFPTYKLLFFWNRYKHFQLGFVILILIYFGSIELLIFSEKQFYESTGLKSQILNMSRPDLHSWLFVTTVTGNSNGVFPLSLIGRIMLSLNSLNFWIGTFLVGISEYITYKTSKKRKEGNMKTHFENHFIIFGWNGTSDKFIMSILDDAKNFYHKKLKIVSVVPDISIVRNNYPLIRELHDNKVIDIIQGDARDRHILEKANTEKADTIILLAEDNSRIADERTQLRALAISRYVKDIKNNALFASRKNNINKIKDFFHRTGRNEESTQTDVSYSRDRRLLDTIYMIAEINNNEFRQSLYDAGVNEVFVSGNYRKAVMKQALFNHGVSKVLDEIMHYDENNEFYKIDLYKKENKHLVGKTFDELLVLLRKVGILLIGIHIIFLDDKGKIIIDRHEIERLLKEKENGITRDIIVNPIDEIERNRPVDDDDQLIVLTYNYKMLKESVKKLKIMMKKGEV